MDPSETATGAADTKALSPDELRTELQRFRADQLEEAICEQRERPAWRQKERGKGPPSPEGRR
jgi:hypothetical protein